MVMDRKGYIKTLEAVIAIVLILIFTFAITPKPTPSYKLPSAVENAQAYTLEEIGRNDTLRAQMMAADPDVQNQALADAYASIKAVIDSNLPAGYDYTVGICKESACAINMTPIAAERSIYTAEAMIGSGGGLTPRIVRIWMWSK